MQASSLQVVSSSLFVICWNFWVVEYFLMPNWWGYLILCSVRSISSRTNMNFTKSFKREERRLISLQLKGSVFENTLNYCKSISGWYETSNLLLFVAIWVAHSPHKTPFNALCQCSAPWWIVPLSILLCCSSRSSKNKTRFYRKFG